MLLFSGVMTFSVSEKIKKVMNYFKGHRILPVLFFFFCNEEVMGKFENSSQTVCILEDKIILM